MYTEGMKALVRFVILVVLLCALIGAGTVAWVDIRTAGHIFDKDADIPHAEVALLLGASVASGGRLSPVMQERADEAALLYESGTVDKILVTGDNSTLEYDEVYPVGKYLLARGIPQKDIFLDYAGFDTYSSIYRAREIFGVQGVLIVSQRYHLPRAVFIAQALGLDAGGVDASEGEKYLYYSLREIPASLKAVFDVWFGRVPKYLGEQFPVSGDSAETWLGSSTQMIYFKNGR